MTFSSTQRGMSRAAAYGPGSSFWLYKELTSSAITQTAADLTGVSDGRLYIKQIIVQTDETGLGGGTNLVIQSNNANGLATILSQAISGLGANKTVTLLDAGTTKVPTILESGKKLQVKSTAADCTGSGKVRIFVECVRLDEKATVEVA